MRRSRLDQIDRKILIELQRDGRITNVELAAIAGISAPPCLRRLRALEDDQVILGYHAEVNPEAVGYKIIAFVQIKLDSNSDTELRAFETRVEHWPQVRECYMLAGDYDFLLRVVARSWEGYQQFLTSELTAAPHVAQIKSSVGVRRAKFIPGIEIAEIGDAA